MHTIVAGAEPSWLARARREIGVKEIPGPKSTARILEYQGATKFLEGNDDVPWCSAFACWVFEGDGIRSTRSAAARSWLQWGRELDAPQIGCVLVFTRPGEPGSGHVGFYTGVDANDQLLVLGGNQGNQVAIRPYPKARLLSCRWPVLS